MVSRMKITRNEVTAYARSLSAGMMDAVVSQCRDRPCVPPARTGVPTRHVALFVGCLTSFQQPHLNSDLQDTMNWKRIFVIEQKTFD